MIEFLIAAGQRVLDSFVQAFSLLDRLSPIFFATSLVVAVVIHARALRRGEEVPDSALGYVFSRHVWLSRSARVDYLFAILNQAATPFWAMAVFFGPVLLAAPIHDILVERLGIFPPPFRFGAPAAVVMALAAFLLADFAIFFSHWLQHRSKLLWEFHKVHHSATVLTPITALRLHPVDTILTSVMTAASLGLCYGVATALVDGAPDRWWLLGGNAVFLAFYAAAFHLRHSHVWLAYPPWLSRWLISPAQHQIHHSCEPRHWDRNMGFALAVWDRLFGTLYVPQGRERFPLGLTDGEHGEYGSAARLFFLPVLKAWRLLRGDGWPARIVVAGLCTLAVIPALNADDEAVVVAGPPPSLQLEALTWLEVEAAVRDGYTTVLLPTGGVEQNGPHLVLGKHNRVVGHTSLKIAEALGRTLVAPVVAYVPEGDPGGGSGHMAFPGTLSVPAAVFDGILEGAARSLQAAGFRLIVFIGDSGGNQAGQQRVADKLTAEWAGQGIRVVHADDYYLANGQTAWLLAQGEKLGPIGRHAGIRDTSEMLAAGPDGVRDELRRAYAPERAAALGLDGDPSRASAARGLRLLKLKIDAAVAQIAAIRGE